MSHDARQSQRPGSVQSEFDLANRALLEGRLHSAIEHYRGALALQPAFEALASRAEASGWSAAEAAGALLELSLDRSRKTGGNAAEDWVKAQALRERRR